VTLDELAAWCLRYAPLTAADPPDGVWIDATGCAHLFGGEAGMLADLTDRLTRAGIDARAAVADTPGAAHAMARYGRHGVVPRGATAQALAPLPVAALRLAPETAAALRRLGLERVGALAAAPRAPLARRFGPGLLTRLDQALGRAPEPLTPVLSPEIVQHRLGFLEPLLTVDALAAAVSPLAEAVCAALERRGLGARCLELVFERVDARVQVVPAGLARPTRAPRHLTRLLAERLDRVDPGLGVEAMRLVVPHAERLGPVQAEALAESVIVRGGTAGDVNHALKQEFSEPADIAALVDRLGNRFGADRVYRVEPVESDVPERAARRVPALAPFGRVVLWPALPRPARLLPYPQPVQALSVLPDHPPAAFVWRRVRHRVRRADGPERVSGEWWKREREVAAVRDYWAVEDEDGRRFWLYRRGDGIDSATGDLSWFLHGLF